MNTLKEILVDAARYRWWRQNLSSIDEAFFLDFKTPEQVDDLVDTELSRVE